MSDATSKKSRRFVRDRVLPGSAPRPKRRFQRRADSRIPISAMAQFSQQRSILSAFATETRSISVSAHETTAPRDRPPTILASRWIDSSDLAVVVPKDPTQVIAPLETATLPTDLVTGLEDLSNDGRLRSE